MGGPCTFSRGDAGSTGPVRATDRYARRARRKDTMVVEMSRDTGNSVSSVEHLYLHMRRTHWETKYHEDLGPHLQDALERLEKEGWEVVTAYAVERTPEIILRRLDREHS
jgi:hypothetical protein